MWPGYVVPVPSPAIEAAFEITRDRGIALVAASGHSSAPVVEYPRRTPAWTG